MACELIVKLYDTTKKSEWDNFVERSLNGTFLQTKRFLDYHPIGRFDDCSLMIYDGSRLIAVCPACKVNDNGEKVFFSHKGSTFGGIILENKQYSVHRIIPIINKVEEFCLNNGFNRIILKQTSDLFSKRNNDLIEFALYYLNFTENKELNLFIDFDSYNDNILSNFSQGKRTNINNCIKKGLEIKKLTSDGQIQTFYDILCSTLEKYDKKPVHTYEELLKLSRSVIPNETEFYGAYLQDKMVAGSMMFYFFDSSVAHTQYLCALHEYDTLSPMSFMYYSMIAVAKQKGFKNISFGIATEDGGRYINTGLVSSKESFGAGHSLNKIFSKTLTDKGDKI